MTRTLAPSALAAELRVAVGRSARRIRAERSDLDLSDTQLSVLFVLEREGPTTPGELADREHVQPPSITRVVNCLSERGLVEPVEPSAPDQVADQQPEREGDEDHEQ